MACNLKTAIINSAMGGFKGERWGVALTGALVHNLKLRDHMHDLKLREHTHNSNSEAHMHNSK